MLKWRHSGFSVHNQVHTKADDAKPHATKRNYQLMPAIKWLRLLMNHIPDRYEHLVRYYGYYSNHSR